jgi:hypothetical protein
MLRVLRNRLVGPSNPRGVSVHAASFIRERRIFLEAELQRNPAEWSRILVHELFHFVWVRLGNGARREWEGVLGAEFAGGARGELGFSAEWRKNALRAGSGADRRRRTRKWREYCCESFCDTAAYVFSGVRNHPEFGLARRFAEQRAEWFRGRFPEGVVRI